jgi:hypothetical protein
MNMDLEILKLAAQESLLKKINDGDLSGADLIKVLGLDESGRTIEGFGSQFVLRLGDE